MVYRAPLYDTFCQILKAVTIVCYNINGWNPRVVRVVPATGYFVLFVHLKGAQLFRNVFERLVDGLLMTSKWRKQYPAIWFYSVLCVYFFLFALNNALDKDSTYHRGGNIANKEFQLRSRRFQLLNIVLN